MPRQRPLAEILADPGYSNAAKLLAACLDRRCLAACKWAAWPKVSTIAHDLGWDGDPRAFRKRVERAARELIEGGDLARPRLGELVAWHDAEGAARGLDWPKELPRNLRRSAAICVLGWKLAEAGLILPILTRCDIGVASNPARSDSRPDEGGGNVASNATPMSHGDATEMSHPLNVRTSNVRKESTLNVRALAREGQDQEVVPMGPDPVSARAETGSMDVDLGTIGGPLPAILGDPRPVAARISGGPQAVEATLPVDRPPGSGGGIDVPQPCGSGGPIRPAGDGEYARVSGPGPGGADPGDPTIPMLTDAEVAEQVDHLRNPRSPLRRFAYRILEGSGRLPAEFVGLFPPALPEPSRPTVPGKTVLLRVPAPRPGPAGVVASVDPAGHDEADGLPAPRVSRSARARARAVVGQLAGNPHGEIETTVARAIAELLGDHKPESLKLFVGLAGDVRHGGLADACLQDAIEEACGGKVRNRGAAFVAAVKRWKRGRSGGPRCRDAIVVGP